MARPALLLVSGLTLLLLYSVFQLSPLSTMIETLRRETLGNGRASERIIVSMEAEAEDDSKVLPALKALREDGMTRDLTSIDDIQKLTTPQLILTIHSYLDNIDIICQRKLRMGRLGDGGWEVCDDADVRPRSSCIVYSFGINYDFSFDDDIARVYGCKVFSFDPSMAKTETHNRSDKVMFYKIGLGPNTVARNRNGWEMKTLQDIRNGLGHRNVTIDVLKMDIENAEWDSMFQIFNTGQLDSVKQLLIEYHVYAKDRKALLERFRIIKGVEAQGFKRFYVHKNFHCPCKVPDFPVDRTNCYEIHYIRRP